MVEFIDKKRIKLDRILSDLDKFVLDFVKVLGKYTKYVIVGGYTAIILGRTRGTEDVDILIPKVSKKEFINFHKDIINEGYWFINSEDINDLFELLITKHGVRVAIDGELAPNIELKFIKDEFDQLAFNNPVVIELTGISLQFGCLEMQIAHKEALSASHKDFEDTRHIRKVLGEHLDKELIEKLKRRLR